MIVSIFGKTEKRPVIYTLMKLFQTLGDTCIITNDRHLMRLNEDGGAFGVYQNIHVYVCDTTPDEMWHTIEQVPEDYDHIILDGLLDDHADLILYIQGAGPEPLDEDFIEMVSSMPGWNVIKFGYGKDCIKYSLPMFKALEEIEYYRQPKPVDSKLTELLAKLTSPFLNIPPKTIVKVVNKK